jgi:hypothetical protein
MQNMHARDLPQSWHGARLRRRTKAQKQTRVQCRASGPSKKASNIFLHLSAGVDILDTLQQSALHPERSAAGAEG